MTLRKLKSVNILIKYVLINCKHILLDNQGYPEQNMLRGERKKKEVKIHRANLMLDLLHVLRFFSFLFLLFTTEKSYT